MGEEGPGSRARLGMALRRIQGLRHILGAGNSSAMGVRTGGREGWSRLGKPRSGARPGQRERGGTGGAATEVGWDPQGGDSQGQSGQEQQCETNPRNWNKPSWESWGVKAVASAEGSGACRERWGRPNTPEFLRELKSQSCITEPQNIPETSASPSAAWVSCLGHCPAHIPSRLVLHCSVNSGSGGLGAPTEGGT